MPKLPSLFNQAFFDEMFAGFDDFFADLPRPNRPAGEVKPSEANVVEETVHEEIIENKDGSRTTRVTTRKFSSR